MSIGLKRGTVRLEPYDIEWERSAQVVIGRLKEILQDDARDIQHIGSTSIKGILAKPIVDIAVGVDSLDNMRKHDQELAEQGFLFRGQDVEGQILYILGEPNSDIRTHYIHVVLWGQRDWENYILFRDYLNCHEEPAARYSNLKRELCGKFESDRGAYTQSKQDLIDEILVQAREWRLKHGPHD